MLSLFYLPSIIYNIVYNYLIPPQHEEQKQEKFKGIQSKYSSENDSNLEDIKPDLKPEKRNGNISSVESIIIEQEISTSSPTEISDIVKVTKDDELPQLSHDNIPDPSPVPQDSSSSSIPQHVPSSDSSIPSPTASNQLRVIIALSDSESDSDIIDDYLKDVISVEPTVSKQDKQNVHSAGPPVTALDALPLLSYPSDYQPHPIKDNSHVIIEDEDEEDDYPPISQNISVPLITPNSFAVVSQPPPQSNSTDGTSSSSPDVELPSYNGELDNDKSVSSLIGDEPSKLDVTEKTVTVEVEGGVAGRYSVSSVNQAAAVGDGGDMWDIPAETVSLTSQKHGDIKKYIPKEKLRRKRSDPEWNQYMEKCMLSGARGKILNSFRQCYREAFDAYRLCCDMLITFGITHASGRTVFQRAALDEIRLWKQDTVAPRPSISNQIKALDVSYLCNSSLFPTLRDVFELDTVPPHEAVMFVQDKLDHKRTKYIKHMALIITELKLQEYFDTAEMLLPLLGMDKLMTIEAYLCEKSLATTFVRTLDELLEPSGERISSLLERLHTEFDYLEQTAQFKFTPEQITTLIKRMLKLYGLEGGAAPNLALSKTVSNLKAILFCRYRKGATEDWTHTLITTVKDSEVLQHALFAELVMYQDFEYAALLYQHVQPKLNILPEELQRYISSANLPTLNENLSTVSEDTEHKAEQSFQSGDKTLKTISRVAAVPTDPVINNGYVDLPPNVTVSDVSSPTSLQVCKDALSAASVIGLDSEWRALLDPLKPTPVALVQLSSPDACFLLDIARIMESCSDDMLTQFVEEVFTDDAILVGYSLLQDFTKLSETCPVMGSKIASHVNVVDLAIAHKHLTRAERIRRSHEIRELVSEGKPLPQSDSVSKETGLARLCEMVFSHPLDKTCQVSDWTRRPLYPEQRTYAALDAYILLPLYYKLTQTFQPTPLQDLTTEVSEIPEECKVVSYIPAFTQATPSYMLRVVVDVPCQGLGKKLRHLGVDCVILENTQSVDDAAKISLAEGRIILSRDGNSDKLVKLTDPGRVYKVRGSNATDQLAEIRQHFNLVVEEEDLFSRCAICNCAYFLMLEPGQAQALKAAQEAYNCSTVEQMYDVYERRKSLVETISVTSDGVTQYGVRLQLDKVKLKKFTETKTFWGCYDCGKMYWDGCHIRNFKEKHNL